MNNTRPYRRPRNDDRPNGPLDRTVHPRFRDAEQREWDVEQGIRDEDLESAVDVALYEASL